MRFVVCTGGPVLFHTGVWQEAVCQTEPVPVYGGRRRTNLLPCLTPPLFGLVYRVNGNAVSTFCAQQRTIIALHNWVGSNSFSIELFARWEENVEASVWLHDSAAFKRENEHNRKEVPAKVSIRWNCEWWCITCIVGVSSSESPHGFFFQCFGSVKQNLGVLCYDEAPRERTNWQKETGGCLGLFYCEFFSQSSLHSSSIGVFFFSV